MKTLKRVYLNLFAISLLLTFANCKVGQGFVSALMPDVSEDAAMGKQVSGEI